MDFTIVLCRWGERGSVTKYNLNLEALSYSAYKIILNYIQKSLIFMYILDKSIPK